MRRHLIISIYFSMLSAVLISGCAQQLEFVKAKDFYEKGDCISAKRYVEIASQKDSKDRKLIELRQKIEECIKREQFDFHMASAEKLPEKDLLGRLDECQKAIATGYLYSFRAKVEVDRINKELGNISSQSEKIRKHIRNNQIFTACEEYTKISPILNISHW